jgi:hypothetical protein
MGRGLSEWTLGEHVGVGMLDRRGARDTAERPASRGLVVSGWCLAALGTALLLASAIAPNRLLHPLLVGGFLLYGLGATVYVARELRA